MTVFYKENSIFKYEEIEIKKVMLEDVVKENELLKSGKTTPLHIWCEKCDFNMILLMCETYPELDVNALDYKGRTPLHILFTQDKLSQQTVAYIISYFVLKGVDLTIKDEYGRTPLHLSCMYDMIEVTNYLLKQGECINILDKYGKSPIYYAIEYGYIETIELLIKEGAKINFDNVPFQPIHIASLCKIEDPIISIKIISLLVESGADVNSYHKVFKYTPLHNAVCLNKYFIVRTLLKLGAKVRSKQAGENEPIHYAKSVRIAKELVKWGADVNVKNDKGQTPLTKAKLYRNKGLIDYYKSLMDTTSKPRVSCI
tara:strand:- start:296 stop:1237 length:942 start_codon:yes stop_codon:yes gene_type:complete